MQFNVMELQKMRRVAMQWYDSYAAGFMNRFVTLMFQ